MKKHYKLQLTVLKHCSLSLTMPSVETNPKSKETPTRFSRRARGIDPVSDLSPSPTTNLKREFKMLSAKGGTGGRTDARHSDWQYFPRSPAKKMKFSSFLTCETREEINNGLFQSITVNDEDDTIIEDTIAQTNDDGDTDIEGTYRLMNWKKMQTGIASNLICKCQANNQVKEFIKYITNNNTSLSIDSISRMAEEWESKKARDIKNEHSIILSDKKGIGIAPLTTITCLKCTSEFPIEPVTTKFAGKNYKGNWSKIQHCGWYEENVKVVLATLACGMGPVDAGDFLSFLDIPKMNSFSKQQFTRIENLVGKHIRDIAEQSMKDMLEEEINMTVEAKWLDYEIFKKDKSSKVGLTVSYDMGWSKRSSGNRYDSLSGHCFFVGSKTRKIVKGLVTSKKCKTCSLAEAKNESPRTHECPRNYEGSSKAMEADGALTLLKDLFRSTDKKVFLEYICADDDSSMRSLLRHETPTSKKGRLPDDIPEPAWLADPTHRIKVASKAIFVLAALPKKQSTCTLIDAIRFKRYYGYMLKVNRGKTLEEICEAANAVVEHLFDNHKYCDSKWCKALREKTYIPGENMICSPADTGSAEPPSLPTYY